MSSSFSAIEVKSFVIIVGYLSSIVYSFTRMQLISLLPLVAMLIIFLMPSQFLKRFSLFSWKKLLKRLALLFLVKLSIYFLYVLTCLLVLLSLMGFWLCPFFYWKSIFCLTRLKSAFGNPGFILQLFLFIWNSLKLFPEIYYLFNLFKK